LRFEIEMKDRHRGSAMFTRSMMMLPVLVLFSMAAAVPQDPSREDLQRHLLTTQDLQRVTRIPWMADVVVVNGPTGPAGTSESSGCPGMDEAILAQNTGLTDSGVQPFHSASGDVLEQTVVYDELAQEHVRELSDAVDNCPVMRFPDGPPVTIRPVEFGDSVAGFRACIDGQSRSAVLVAAHGEYVVELVASDSGHPDDYYLALLQAAFARVDAPS
jgi:hypothetical protein